MQEDMPWLTTNSKESAFMKDLKPLLRKSRVSRETARVDASKKQVLSCRNCKCTVFRLLQAVPIQPPTFDFTPFSKKNVCSPAVQQAAASSLSMYGVGCLGKVGLKDSESVKNGTWQINR